MKICKTCNIEKELLEFRKGRNKCKECTSIYNKEYMIKYREENKEKLKEEQKEYYRKNSDNIKKNVKKYRDDNKDMYREYFKQFYIDNKEKITERRRKYKEENPDKVNEIIRKSSKKYYLNNKKQIKEYTEKYKVRRNEITKIRRMENPLYNLKCRVRGTIYKSISCGGYSKKTRTYELLGCEYKDFLIYLNDNPYGFLYGSDVWKD